MNNGKLCGLVVLLCVICPILVGYAWPVDAGTEIGYETGDPSNISADAVNTKIPVFAPYNDPFNNNMNVFNEVSYNNFPAQVTPNPGPVWNALDFDLQSRSVTTDGYGFYEISDIRTWSTWDAKAVVFPIGSTWDEIDVGQGAVADLVLYYPETQKLLYRHMGTHEFRPLDDYSMTFSGPMNSTVSLEYLLYYPGAYYADLSYGMNVPVDESDWFNGYLNKGMNIIFSTTSYNETIDLVIQDSTTPTPIYPNNTHIQIVTENGLIKLRVYDRNDTLYYVQDLGENSIYDKVLLTVDYDSAKIGLSGLRGLTSFIGDYNTAIRQTITAEWEDPVTFYSFTIHRNSTSSIQWYVADTISGVANTDGSHDYILRLRQYTASGSCQVNILSAQIHGERMTFAIDGRSFTGNITDGIMSVTAADGHTIKAPINNLLIGMIGQGFYINGETLISYEDRQIEYANILFPGDWKLTMYYYPMTETDRTVYSWLPGGFGLDVMGFCSVGLITSFGSALGLGLYGRRSGIRMGLVAMTAMFCGAAYLIFMMNGGI